MPSPPWSVWVQRPEAKLICLKFCKGRSSLLHLETVEFSLQALKRSALSPITPDLTHHVYQFSKLAVTLDLNLVAQNYRNLCLTAAEARRPKSRWCRAMLHPEMLGGRSSPVCSSYSWLQAFFCFSLPPSHLRLHLSIVVQSPQPGFQPWEPLLSRDPLHSLRRPRPPFIRGPPFFAQNRPFFPPRYWWKLRERHLEQSRKHQK